MENLENLKDTKRRLEEKKKVLCDEATVGIRCELNQINEKFDNSCEG